MAQADYSIANQGFPATRADINSHLEAIATNNSGTSAPSTQYAGQFWIDTTTSTWTLYIHDGADDIQFATIDTSANTVNFTDSALDVVTDTTPQLGGDLDVNGNEITSASNGNIVINPNGTGIIELGSNVGIGTASPSVKFEISGNGETLRLTDTDTALSDNELSSQIEFYQSDSSGAGVGASIGAYGDGTTGSLDLRFATGANTERMRIDKSGNLLIAKTSPSSGSTGLELDVEGFFQATRNGVVGLFNRITTDGTLFSFRQDGSQEGTISVSGSTVSYNGFTGTHWSRFTDNSKPTILKGTVLESLDEMCDWYNLEFDVTTQDENGNNVTHTEKVPHILADGQSVGDVITYDWNTEKKDEDDNDIIEQVQATIVKETDIKHVKSKVSDTVDAKNVYGVFYAWDDNDEEEGYNDFYVASVGSFVVRIKANETIAKGDLLQSNGDGTAKVQTDDAVRSSSFAKVLSTTIIETYEDGSYLVPCSLMC